MEMGGGEAIFGVLKIESYSIQDISFSDLPSLNEWLGDAQAQDATCTSHGPWWSSGPLNSLRLRLLSLPAQLHDFQLIRPERHDNHASDGCCSSHSAREQVICAPLCRRQSKSNRTISRLCTPRGRATIPLLLRESALSCSHHLEIKAS